MNMKYNDQCIAFDLDKTVEPYELTKGRTILSAAQGDRLHQLISLHDPAH